MRTRCSLPSLFFLFITAVVATPFLPASVLAQSGQDSAAAKKRAAAAASAAASKAPGATKLNAAAASAKTKAGPPPTTPTAAASAAGKGSEPDSAVVRAREAQIAELINDPPAATPVGGGTAAAAGNHPNPKAGGKDDPKAPVVVVASKSELTPLDALDLEALELFARWLTAPPDAASAPKESDLDAFMTRSRNFVRRRPDEQRPWLLRARIALRTNRAAEGTEAAENLKRLGAVASLDERTHRMMLALNLKGWLQADTPLNPELGRILAAAELGDSEAQGLLSRMFETGSGGVAKNPAEALRWRLKAAAAGDADSQLGLAALYRNGGGGVPKDDAQAVVWYRKAARQGNVAAQDVLRKRDLSW